MDKPWVYAVDLVAVPDNDVVAARVAGLELAIYGLDGGVYASDNLCTHGNARLCDGFLEDGAIECPLHQGRFDVKTGKALCKPLTADLRIYPVRIDAGRVYIDPQLREESTSCQPM